VFQDGSECEDADNECDMGPGTENDPANYFNVVYEDKTAPNYRNDENVIKDPKRVLSWVKGTSGYIPQQQIPTAAIKKQQKAVVPFVPPVSAPVQFPPIPAPIPLSNVSSFGLITIYN
jgi:hypothetical protein